MIGYVFLALGTAGTAGVLYAVAPAGRGAHRYVVPRSKLRAEAAKASAEAEELACKLIGLAAEIEGTYEELREALTGKEKAEQQVALLERQLKGFDELCAENTALRAHLANLAAVRPLPAADDVTALDDAAQEFTDLTSTAWRARA
ncbi:hypothetical protein [Streptomyces sp. G1]|uniref:hypothetical protein n=1 Tax=Streptomyces sp. G1 TaxID=361572 RepID=UPI00202DC131|nr:hypothetical protein [Streptomyces sp. G1]